MSVSQAGIYSLKLYENKGFSFSYDSSGNIVLSSIASTGDILEFTSDSNEMKFANEIKPAANNKVINDYTLLMHIDGLTQTNLDTLEKLRSSIYGWVPLIEFMDNQVYLIEVPFFEKVSTVNTQISHTFRLEFKPQIFTFKELEGVVESVSDDVPVPNSGAEGTTDWIDSNLDGLADDWQAFVSSGYSIPSDSNGFTGRYQNIGDSGTGFQQIEISDTIVTIGSTYKLSLKYRNDSSNNTLKISDTTLGDMISVLMPINSGLAQYFVSDSFIPTTNTLSIAFQIIQGGTLFQIDELILIKQ